MNENNSTTKIAINNDGYTLVEWLRKANVNINLANNNDTRAWRNNVDPNTYKR